MLSLATLITAAAVAAMPVPHHGVERTLHRSGQLVLLGDWQDDCPEHWKKAGFAQRKPDGSMEKVMGCWIEQEKVVYIQWEDGDQSAIPDDAFDPQQNI